MPIKDWHYFRNKLVLYHIVDLLQARAWVAFIVSGHKAWMAHVTTVHKPLKYPEKGRFYEPVNTNFLNLILTFLVRESGPTNEPRKHT